MDRDHIAIGSFEDEPDDVACWLQHTPEERLAAMERLGRQFLSDEEPRPELCRFLEIAE